MGFFGAHFILHNKSTLFKFIDDVYFSNGSADVKEVMITYNNLTRLKSESCLI